MSAKELMANINIKNSVKPLSTTKLMLYEKRDKTGKIPNKMG